MNRQWKTPNKHVTPCVYHMKELLRAHKAGPPPTQHAPLAYDEYMYHSHAPASYVTITPASPHLPFSPYLALTLSHLHNSPSNQEHLVFFCDLHGHSRKFDFFVYGCHNKGANALSPPHASTECTVPSTCFHRMHCPRHMLPSAEVSCGVLQVILENAWSLCYYHRCSHHAWASSPV